MFRYIFCLSFLSIAYCLDFRLSTSKVLLPYSSFVPINFTLAAESELKYCYSWTSTSPEVATVTPSNEECSQSAVITATWKNSYRASTAILVENLMTGHTIKCDVIVDKPSKLEIETTTQELYLHDAPESLVARAYDDLGNIFSSLTGLPFEWTITSAHGAEGLNILRFITWTESEYEIPKVIGNLEGQGLQGDQQLVSGIKTGSAYVEVAIKDNIYPGVSKGRVRLLVMANAILKPGLAYLIPKTSLNFQVLVFHQGNLNKVPMPSPQYYLRLNDETKASLDIENSRLLAKDIGEVEVSLFDRNIEENEAFKRPKSMISIVEPSYLTFTALPGKRWALDLTRTYTLIIDIFDHNSHRIWPSDDLRLEVTLPDDYLQVLESSRNGTWHLIRPRRTGNCIINGLLAKVQTADGVVHDLTSPVSGSQEVEIYDPVTVLPTIVTLPFSAEANRSTCRLAGSGGSGDYNWMSSSAQQVVVSSKGVVTGQAVGEANITAADVRNPDNVARSTVRVAEPTDLSFLASAVEAEIGHSLELPIAMYASRRGPDGSSFREPMCSCAHMPFEFEFEDSAVFELIAGPNATAGGQSCRNCGELGCASVRVKALRRGFTRLIAKYKATIGNGAAPIVADVMLGAYKPLKPVDDHFVVSLGSQETLQYRGGPQPWVLDPSSYRAELDGPEASKLVEVEIKKDRHTSKTQFLVRCIELGELRLSLSVSNLPTAKNRFPAKRSAKVTFVCATPTSLRLQPLLNLPKLALPPCPVLSEEASRIIPVHNYRQVQVRVIVLDAEGRQFTNMASLRVSVESSDQSVATAALADENSALSLVTLSPKEKNGTVQLSVGLPEYKSEYRKKLRRRPEALASVTGSLVFHTAPDAAAQPSELVTYYRQAKALAYLADGSGHFYAERPTSSQVSPKVQGRFLSASSDREEEVLVTLHDLCMERPQALIVPVLVVALRSLRLAVEDKLLLGANEPGSLTFLAKGDRAIPWELTAHLELEFRSVPDGVVSVKFDRNAGLTVHAESVGTARLQAVCAGVHSNWAQVVVFPPLRLRPPNITVLIGSVLQLQAVGGPQAATLLYSIADSSSGRSSIASVSESGLLSATAQGKLRVRAESVGQDGNGNTRLFSAADGWVNVVKLTDLRIHAPVTAIKAGNCLPLWATAHSGVGPIAMATVSPALQFHWSLDGEGQVGKLTHLLAPVGIPLTPQRAAAGVRLCGISAGQAVVRLRVRKADWRSGQSGQHSAQLTVRIVPALKILGQCAGVIRMAPGSVYDLGVPADTKPVGYSLHEARQPGDQAVGLSDSGQLTASSGYGGAYVTISSLGQHSYNQSVTIKVEVCPVAYLMLAYEGPTLPTMRADLHHLPTGGVYQLRARAYTSLGDEIHAVNLPLTTYASQLDYVQLSDVANQSFSLRSTNDGYTAFHIVHNGLEDFAIVFSASALVPHDARVPIGSIICFNSPFLANQVSWLSTERQVLNLSSTSGVGVAVGIGKSLLTLSAASTFTAATELTVTAISQLSLSLPASSRLSNTDQARPVYASVTPTPTADMVYGENCSVDAEALGAPLTCRLRLFGAGGAELERPERAATAAPAVQSGQLACRIAPAVNQDASLVSEQELSLELTATIAGISSKPVSLPFVPAVLVASKLPLTLSDDGNGELRLLANPAAAEHLVVKSGRPDLLEVQELQQTPGAVTVPLRLLAAAAKGKSKSSSSSGAGATSLPAEVRLSVRQAHIRQTIDIVVRLRRGPGSSSSASSSSSDNLSEHRRHHDYDDAYSYQHQHPDQQRHGASFLDNSARDSLVYIGIGTGLALLIIIFTVRFLQPPQPAVGQIVAPAGVRHSLQDADNSISYGAAGVGGRHGLDRSSSGPALWSQGYGYTSSSEFSPVSPFRRSPNSSFGMRSAIHD